MTIFRETLSKYLIVEKMLTAFYSNHEKIIKWTVYTFRHRLKSQKNDCSYPQFFECLLLKVPGESSEFSHFTIRDLDSESVRFSIPLLYTWTAILLPSITIHQLTRVKIRASSAFSLCLTANNIRQLRDCWRKEKKNFVCSSSISSFRPNHLLNQI